MKRGSEQAQSLLKEYLDHNPVLSFVKDEQGRYVYVNQRFLEFFDIDEATVLGKTDFDWLPYKTAKHFADNDEYVRSSGKILETVEETQFPRGLICCLVHKFPIKNSNGGWCVGGVAADITERMETERKLKKATHELSLARDQALEVSALKSSFISNVSHEFRTPLTGILAAIELLTATNLNEEQESLLKIAQESSAALLALVNNILDLSKIEAGKMEIEIESFNLTELVQECVAIISEEAQKKNLSVTTKIDQAIPKSMQGDGQRVRQALLNLLGNSVKFTDAGKINIEVQIEEKHKEQLKEQTPKKFDEHFEGMIDEQLIRFNVEDTGIGISKEELQLLFKPFSQVDSSSTRKHPGTGLGLYISKQLVEIMGGTIWIESTKGKGTLCSFIVPFKPCVDEFAGVAGIRGIQANLTIP